MNINEIEKEFENKEVQIIERLIQLLPAVKLSDEFGIPPTQTKKKAAELILKKQTRASDFYTDFARSFGYAHQHVYIFRIDESDLSVFSKPIYPLKHTYRERVHDTADLIVEDYLIPVDYLFWARKGDQVKDKKIHHLWPVRVTLKKKILEIRLHPMKQSYRKLPDSVVPKSKDLDEEIIRRAILSSVPSARADKRLDLNKSIKEAMEQDIIDMFSVSFTSSNALEKLIMKDDKLVKHMRPERYVEVLKNPIEDSLFKVTKSGNYPRGFRANPSDGFFSFALHQPTSTALDVFLKEVYDLNK